ncbi:Uncharacterised protein [Serratia plymuthica]|nr:Uncharacterised protein [Serratia plymuthica]
MYFNYLALVYISLADAILLGENVHATRWLAMGIGFIGIIVMLWAHLTDSNSLLSGGFMQVSGGWA